MSIGFITVKQDRIVDSMQSSIIKFGKKDCSFVRWYPEGQLQFNDVVVSVKSSKFENKVFVEIMCWDNKDVYPVRKELGAEDPIEFVTVFAENEIRISGIAEGEIEIFVNEQRRTFRSGNPIIILAVRLGRIVYFSCDEGQNENVLLGEPFPAYIDWDGKITIDDFFKQEIVTVMDSLSEEEPKGYAAMENKTVCIEKRFTGETQENSIYFIGDVDDYFQLMKSALATYNKLYYENELKIHENQLDNVARLKGFGKNILEINKKFEKVCRKNVTIVLTGESGTGKTYFAKQIHNNSKRSNAPFVSVNCAAIAPNLIESELFGYEDGAFTGARRGGKPGYFEMASGGTLFLDEISELPILLQGRLLEVLQENTFYRVGGTKKITVDIRLIVATNKNLEKMVRDGLFREDLYYRINVFPIHLPPLRERTQDMYSIIEDTLPGICQRLDMDMPIINHEAMMEIQSYNWPGNIRELENVLEKAAVMSEDNVIKKEDIIIGEAVKGVQIAKTLKEKMNDYEKSIVNEAYERFNGDRKMMEEYLGVSKTNLFEKIHKYGLAKEDKS